MLAISKWRKREEQGLIKRTEEVGSRGTDDAFQGFDTYIKYEKSKKFLSLLSNT